MNEHSQVHIDFRTGRQSAIHFDSPIELQRAACHAVNGKRKSAILDAAQQTSRWESLTAHVWHEQFAQHVLERGIPLIDLDDLGISHDADGMRCSAFLAPLTSGAEACPYLDEAERVVYKLFDLRIDGSLGKKIALTPLPEGGYDVTLQPARLPDTLEKIALLNIAGAHPTEIVGIAASGDYLIVKQPLALPAKHYVNDREESLRLMHAITPNHTRLRRAISIFSVEGKPWLLGDLHQGNIMRNRENQPTIIDALTGPVPPEALRQLEWLQHAAEDTDHLRRGIPPVTRHAFGDDTDDDEL